MRRAYQTDLSDAEWACIEPHLPTPKAPGRPRVHSLREILITPSSSTSSKAAVHGAYFPMTFLLGRLSTITSELGGSTVLGRGCTLPCASGCACVWAEILSPVPASSRQPIGQDHRRGRGARLRWWEEG